MTRLPRWPTALLCGWSTIDHDGIDPAAEHAAHVVAALTNAGKAIVDQAGQPDEEMAENEDEYGYKEWKTGVGRATAHTDDTVTIDSGYHFNVKPVMPATSLPRFWLLLVWRRAVTSRE
ncbi:hypothetical protein GTA09_20730 [Rhodococcus hoagii]|nr:hypothetical protein [Prescottella equi]